MTDTCKEIRKYFKEFVITTSNELHRNYEDIGVSLGRFWTLVGDDVANELRILDHDSHQVQQALHDLYINNDFYLRSIYDSTIGSETAKSLWNVMAFNGRLLLDIIESVKDSLRLAVTHIKGACKNLCNTFDNIMSGRIQDIPYVILHFAEQVNEFGIQTVHDATLYGLKFLKDILSLWVPSLNEFTTPEWIRRVSNNVKGKYFFLNLNSIS